MNTFHQNKNLLPSERFKRRIALTSLMTVILIGLAIILEFRPILFFTEVHHLVNLLVEMLPPNINILWEKKNIIFSIQETMAMAFLGTVVGGSLAIVIAFFAANNTTPFYLVRIFIRALILIERVIPSLVFILVFVIAVGLGPFAGMLALTFSTIGTFGKLFSDTIEEVDPEPVEAIYAIGANKLQAIKYSILPQVLPSFIGNLFYSFDVNLRAAIGLGIFGGGGIGFEIHMAMKMLRYKDALALILFTIVLITIFERLSDYFRNRIFNKEILR